jgi:predicted O-methyltransferase YrrM
MIQYPRYPLELTKFKTENYRPGNHYTNLEKWDNFTMHVPLWNQVLTHFFENQTDLRFLELGSGNGLCANYLLDNWPCYVDTVDIEECRIVKENDIEYSISTINNLKPFIDTNRCSFHLMSTKDFLINNQDKQYDFIYIDASHDKDWVLYDAVTAFNLLKVDGLLIFDDYGWGECSIGIDNFLNCYDKHVEIFYKSWQIMIRKLSNL